MAMMENRQVLSPHFSAAVTPTNDFWTEFSSGEECQWRNRYRGVDMGGDTMNLGGKIVDKGLNIY
jgi:hypothetical protein